MSVHKSIKRITASEIQAKKKQEPIVSLTAYQAYSARIADPHCDFLLVGDSVGMIVHGFDTTLPVDVDMMILHGKAVMRGSQRALVVVDMPFGSYEKSPEQAFSNASRILADTGCGAVKLEGGIHMAKTIDFLCKRGIPVMSHIGLTPQAVNHFGGFKTQGRDKSDWEKIEADAAAIEDAGAFAVVVEAVVEPLAVKLTEKLSIPTIGIGASNQCDGQILVMEDMLGYGAWAPKFVRRYGTLEQAMDTAIRNYAEDVKSRAFPSDSEIYKLK
ncbi:3-methyl-2-oxobutanoate hydroxymethyltransferase [Bartonella bacilliformis str. Heidi Mejia]|uniref:3-methyl-2-oxobutanoate hydroxymethyltransferase n=2 Tax=Bartonella bacilliformis TaxID=774 RepID=PANB_BARBK|nr:3-methyl-2-oxobutanoate hydroxymethyltransferase [Bartonella bacilliformis]A1US40.1 RecName: Full=3-methyl-2-oxobutanoate hydroxymethyltransferase; AltName: Full=Ketopantoate hydroxymethyltransferase; Short=KPHMT [Bartonella bacilliformis KC583]ABM44890.1 3-methyl-2-oxobutanoate hydroxymethyltransferase [Bartonella bacilliformis KC583]AMG85626.1 3-methyl-2-oxobutanoate hydroxymethyltransferase [Bartonella bacilliformis]EKS45042.1 3-methyl-2-oxobutanoate hydroxymethyltransferase [Bartonella b